MSFLEKVQNGFTIVPNRILDLITKGTINRNEFVVLLYVLMLNNFKRHRTSGRQIATILNMNKNAANECLKTLEEKTLIETEKIGNYIIVHCNIVFNPVVQMDIKTQKEIADEFDRSDFGPDDSPSSVLDSVHPTPECTISSTPTVRNPVHIELRLEENIKSNIYTHGVTSQKEEADEILNIWCKAKLKGHEDMGFRDQFAGKLMRWSRDRDIALSKLKTAVINYARIKEDKNIAYDNNWPLSMFLGLVGGQFRGERFFDENFDISQFKKNVPTKGPIVPTSGEHAASLKREAEQRIKEKKAYSPSPVRTKQETQSIRSGLEDILKGLHIG